MKTITLSLICFLFSISLSSQSVATYNITFTSIWNATDHTSLPNGAHWSKLVGANHNSNVTFWELGGIATQGIEDVAELGSNTVFNNEVNSSISNGNTEQYIDGSSLGSATGTIIVNGLEVSENYPLLTLLSMIAPSPDWIIGVNSINLRNASNTDWQSSITLDLYPYDAGTDSGANYNSENSDTTPHEPISNFFDGGLTPPFNDKKIGTLEIELQNVLNTNNNNLNSLKILPNPSKGIVNIININRLQLEQIQVYDVLGKRVYSQNLTTNSNSTSLNLESLNKGLYLLKISDKEGKTKTQKLVLQ